MNICLYYFIALSIEADAAVDRAFSSANSDEILSEAFRLQVAGKDLATLKFQNWLNDEVSIEKLQNNLKIFYFIYFGSTSLFSDNK